VVPVNLLPIPEFSIEIVRQKSSNVSSAIEVDQIRDWRTDGSRFETIGMCHYPGGHETTITPSHHAKLIRISDPNFNNMANANHQIPEIATPPVVLVGMVTRTFHEAGIPIVVGTDSGSWPHFLNLLHGPTTVREMELLVEPGMEPAEVIASATIIPATMMGIEHEVGSIEIGKRANLLILEDDPLQDISSLKSLLWVVKDGKAWHPNDWLYTPPAN